jgi:hypothetical protein
MLRSDEASGRIVMLRVVIAVVLLAHGIGHSMGLLQVFKVATINPAWNGDSWLLSGVVGTSASQAIGVVCWSVAMVGFAMLAAVTVGWLPAAWWPPIAVISAIGSLLGILVFPLAFPAFSVLGAVVVDVAVLAAALWLHWLPTEVSA